MGRDIHCKLVMSSRDRNAIGETLLANVCCPDLRERDCFPLPSFRAPTYIKVTELGGTHSRRPSATLVASALCRSDLYLARSFGSMDSWLSV